MLLRRSLPILALLAAACDSPEPIASTAQVNIATINIHDFFYSSAAVSVKVGSVVQWVNLGPSAHTATSDDGLWDSGQLGVSSSVTPGSPSPGSTPPPDTTVTAPPGNTPEIPLPIPPGNMPEVPLPIPPGGTPGTPLPIPPGGGPETPLPIPPGSSPETPLPSPPPGNTPGAPLPSQPPGNTPGTPLPTPPASARTASVTRGPNLQPQLAVGSTVFQFTFNTVGTYSFHCSIHPPTSYPNFVGTVTVTN